MSAYPSQLFGPGHISRDQADGWRRVQCRHYRCADPTLQRSRSVLPAVTAICGGYHPTVWAKRRWLPAGDRVAEMVHHQMLPRPLQHLNDRDFHHSAQEAPPGIGSSAGRVLKRQTWTSQREIGGRIISQRH